MNRAARAPVWGGVTARVGVVGGMALVASCASCASPPPALPVSLAPAASSAVVRSASAPPALPSRWLRRGVSSPGVRLAKGRLALVDGVRTLIADDGSFAQAADATRLDSLLLVPGASGPAVVGVAGRVVLRFDEPLGGGVPITRAAADITSVGTWPGLVTVSTANGTLWFDLEGRPRPSPVALPPHASAFVDARVGVAIFPISGPAFTRDGGASWSLVDAPGAASVDADEGWLRLRAVREDAEDRRVDVATGGLSRPPPPRPRDPPFVRWLRDAGDPLLAAVSSGVMVGTTRALVASGDLMAEVDLVTGLPVDFTSLAGTHDPAWPLPGGWEATPARAAGSERDPSSRSPVPLVYFSRPDHVGPVLLVALAGPREPKTVFDATPRQMRFTASSSGGWMVAAACPGDPPGADVRCVRQPDGTRGSVRAALEHAGPRADGGLVGMRAGEHETAIVAVDAAGESRTIASRAREDGERLVLSAALDELPGGALLAPYSLWRKQGASEAGAMVVRGGSVSLVPAGEASTTVRCLAGRCAAVGADGAQASFDVAVGVWRKESGPGRVGRAPLRVSEVGWSSGRGVRLGWGPADPPPPDEVVMPAPSERALLSVVCDIGPPRAGSLPYLRAVEGDPAEIYQALVPPRVAARDRRSQTYGIGVFAAQGVLATDADPETTTSRGTLSFHWVDHTELGAHARHAALPGWTGSFPYIASVVASRDHAVFVGSSEPTTAGRANGGRLEVTGFPHTAVSSGAFSADGAFAWWTEDQGIGHWPARGAPRVLARVARGALAIGAPTADGVPVMAYDHGWAAVRVVPVSDPLPGRLDVAGWRPARFSLDALAALPVCARDAAGFRFSLPVDVDVVLPGTPPAFGPRSELVVRVSTDAACLDGVFFEQRDRFARIDLRGGVAEGGEAGLRGRVTSLTCRVKRLPHVRKPGMVAPCRSRWTAYTPCPSRRRRRGPRPTTSRASARDTRPGPTPTRARIARPYASTNAGTWYGGSGSNAICSVTSGSVSPSRSRHVGVQRVTWCGGRSSRLSSCLIQLSAFGTAVRRRPPGRSSLMASRRNARGSARCSSSWKLATRSNSPGRSRATSARARGSTRRPSSAARRTAPGLSSMPSASAPFAAASATKSPSPAPISRSRSPRDTARTASWCSHLSCT